MPTLEIAVPKDEIQEIKKLVSTLILLPEEERLILMANANAFKIRKDMEKARKEKELQEA